MAFWRDRPGHCWSMMMPLSRRSTLRARMATRVFAHLKSALRLHSPTSLCGKSVSRITASILNHSFRENLRNRVPVFATALRLGEPGQHLRWFGGVTEARFVPDVGPDQAATVWATGLSTRIPIGPKDSLIAKGIVGNGADSLISSRSLGDAGVAVPAGGFETLTEYGYDVAYQHYWRDDLRSNIAYRWGQLDNSPTQPGDALRSVQYLAVNLIWRPIPQLDIGAEYLFGQRENKDRIFADANRLQFSAIWRLP